MILDGVVMAAEMRGRVGWRRFFASGVLRAEREGYKPEETPMSLFRCGIGRRRSASFPFSRLKEPDASEKWVLRQGPRVAVSSGRPWNPWKFTRIYGRPGHFQ